jgi:hypothetical protein
MNGKIYVAQVGASIELDTQDEIAILGTATTLKIKFRRPDGISGAWDVVRSGSVLKYQTTAPSDLPIAGVWKLQAYGEGNGWKIRGETVDFNVHGLFG